MVLSITTGLLVLMLVTTFAISAKGAFDRQQAARHALSVVSMSRNISAASDELHIEDGAIGTALATADAATPQTLKRIALLHRNSGAALDALLIQWKKAGLSGRGADIGQISAMRPPYEAMFARVMAALRLAARQRPDGIRDQWSMTVGALLEANDLETNTLSGEIADIDPFVDEMAKVGRIGRLVRVPAGLDRRLLASAIENHEILSFEKRQQFAELMAKIDSPWGVIEEDAKTPNFPPALRAAIHKAHQTYFTDLRARRLVLIDQLSHGRNPGISGQQWLRICDNGLNSITATYKTAFDLTLAHMKEQVAAASRNFAAAVASILLSIALAGFAAWFVVWRVIKPLRQITHTMRTVIDGNLKCKIPLQERQDEIGQFARTLSLFRDGAIERQRLETELIQNLAARQTAEASSRVKSEFLANMSHELRTPLNAIIGFSDMMKQKMYGPLCAQYDQYATLIHESGHHLLNLISDILDVAKIEAGKFTLDLQTVDLVEAVQYCLQLNQRRADERGVRLTSDIAETQLRFVADPRALRQILLNLVSNAVKFTGQGGEVHVAAQMRDGWVGIVVRDNGIGIPQEALSRIGQAFEQASNDPMCAREGTGLGLALVRALVIRHGGSLRIESTEKVGTVVTVELPVAQAAQAAA
jgi:signal transduction histidine kinase